MNASTAQMLLGIAIHHLWQSAALACCVWLAFKARRHWSAESRYWVWTAALLLVALLPLLSQLPLPRLEALPQVGNLATTLQQSAVLSDGAQRLVAQPASDVSNSGQLAIDWHLLVTWLSIALLTVWLAGFLWRVAALLRGAHILRRWIREAQRIVPDCLALPRSLLANCEVKESAHVSAPLVAGFLRPSILIPVGLHERLSRSQLALVLRHELAHVRRGDAWLLLVQRLIEAVYFYNPVVHLMARRVERERERSCDDRAVQPDPARATNIDYADCLVDISRSMVARRAPALGVGAIRAPSELRARVERLLGRSESEDTRLSAGSVAVVSFALVIVAAALALTVPHADAAERDGATLVASASNDARDEDDESAMQGTAMPRDAASHAFVRELAEDGMSLDRVQDLIRSGVDVNYALEGDGTPLIIAARRGDLRLVKLLLENRADVDRFSAGDGNPLIAAAAAGQAPVAEVLVEHGANVNAHDPYDETPLINAAREGSLALVDYLISQGADVNLAVRASTLRGAELRSPLSEARKHGHDTIVERLQRAGAAR